MTKLYTDLYQFTQVLEPIKLSMHLYLLLVDEPILIQTGSIQQAETTIPQIKELLGDKTLKYILVSHFESDECGGLSLILREYPNAITVCSEITARQLMGFGITKQFEIKRPGDKLAGGSYCFSVIAYPSEMHLWEGILFYEEYRGVFFSSDLMFAIGVNHGQVVEKTWEEALKSSSVDLIPNVESQEKMIHELQMFSPNFVASGHGPCMKIIQD